MSVAKVISIVLIALGAFSMYVLSKWSRWRNRYEGVLQVPTEFTKNPGPYWLFPAGLLFANYYASMFGGIQFIYVLVAYGIAWGAGQYRARKRYIDRMTAHLVEKEKMSYKKAKSEAIEIEKTEKIARRFK